MKAITLHQPWASLVALGVKTIETRSWSTRYRGLLAIHAAKTGEWDLLTVGEWTYHHHGDEGPEIRRLGAVDNGRLVADRYERGLAHPCPLSAVVCVSKLGDVVPMITVAEAALHPGPWLTVSDKGLGLWRGGKQVAERVSDQRPYGDYTPGRFGWVLVDIESADPPVPARGRQGLWEWTP